MSAWWEFGLEEGGVTSHGLLGIAFWKGKVVRRSFLLLDSWRASKAELKEGDSFEISVSRECALTFLGVVLGRGSNL
jgi:hypothetical protein